jgi:hypothetical protein
LDFQVHAGNQVRRAGFLTDLDPPAEMPPRDQPAGANGPDHRGQEAAFGN